MKILSFDIEEWWVYDHYSIGNKTDYIPRLNNYLNDTLDVLEEKQIVATFFCLGLVADSYPEVIKRIANRGHEIGCHSYSHQFFGNSTREVFAEDTYKALDTIENIIGKKVLSYRAPAFSITEKNTWAFEILIENGIEYDCSIFPAERSFGGFPQFSEKTPSLVKYQDSILKEFPMSVTPILGRDIAYSGGGYFRLFPYRLIKEIMNKNEYVMTYFHLKDFDKDQKRLFASLEGESAIVRYFKKYYGLKSSYTKFKKLIYDFEFISVKEAAKHIKWEKAPVISL